MGPVTSRSDLVNEKCKAAYMSSTTQDITVDRNTATWDANVDKGLRSNKSRIPAFDVSPRGVSATYRELLYEECLLEHVFLCQLIIAAETFEW
jgi:hypothetical protein